jgi:glycosyltransferase involved in cell wall biosynthesis
MVEGATLLSGSEAAPGRRTEVTPNRSFGSLSIVIPTYNEAESIGPLHDELVAVLERLGVPFELLWIDDGSTDETPAVMRGLCARDLRVRYVRFRRNFGKAAALSEGFRHARGEVLVTIDGDLQDDPAELPKLLDRLDEGYDLVSGWKWPRQDPLGKRLPSRIFNGAIRFWTGVKLHDHNCGYKVYRREIATTLSLYGDMHRYVPVLAHAKGFRVSEVKVTHRPRQHGRSKYSVGRFSRGFLDFLTVLFLTRYSRRPLHLIGGLALIMGLVGGGVLLWLTVGWFLGQPIAGRPLFFLGILLVVVAMQLLTFGLLAEMVTSFFVERRNEYPLIEVLGTDDILERSAAGALEQRSHNGPEASSG